MIRRVYVMTTFYSTSLLLTSFWIGRALTKRHKHMISCFERDHYK